MRTQSCCAQDTIKWLVGGESMQPSPLLDQRRYLQDRGGERQAHLKYPFAARERDKQRYFAARKRDEQWDFAARERDEHRYFAARKRDEQWDFAARERDEQWDFAARERDEQRNLLSTLALSKDIVH
eukprot:364607-Chlamydomonas_euryale.AAC.5